MLKFFKNKKIGYYLMIADAILALVLGIVFFSTYKTAMANNASAHVPEVIGICAFLAFVLEVIALAIPEHKWVHIASLVAICFSFMKEVYLVPNLIADKANKVEFQGGNLSLNILYLVLLVAILGLSIASSFLDVLEKDEKVEIKEKKNIIRYSASGAVALAASLASIILVANLRSAASKIENNEGKVVLDAIQEKYQDKVIEYEFEPKDVKIKEKDNIYANLAHPLKAIPGHVGDSYNRTEEEGVHLVYKFEGFYAEGYQGNYNKTYAYIYLWEDGLYNGEQNGSKIYGYWYNQEENGQDCLAMIDSRGSENDMICTKSSSKLYDWITDVRTTLNGGRSIKVNGYYYYPMIAMYVDTGSSELKYNYGDVIDTNEWTAMRVLNDLRYGPVFDQQSSVNWTIPDTKSVYGDQVIIAKNGDFEADVPITIVPDTAEYVLDASAETIKKNYRYVDRFDPTGLVITRKDGDNEEVVDFTNFKRTMDIEHNKIVFDCPNAKQISFDVVFDTTAEANTIKGEIADKAVTLVISSYEKMTATVEDKKVEVKIELTGKGLATIKVLEKISGDDEIFALLPESFGLAEEEVEGVKQLTFVLSKYFRSSNKANPYSQSSDTFFLLGSDTSYIIAFWIFSYQGEQTQEMKCAYTGEASDGNTINLTSCIQETNGQWTWSSNKRFTLKDCTISDIPFAPTLK